MNDKLLLDEPPQIVLPSLACLVGVGAAIFLQQVHYWCIHYRSINDRHHYHRGRWWMWNPVTSQRGKDGCWTAQFPYWSESTIKRMIVRLRTLGFLLVDRFNDKGYDRTNWYTVHHEVLEAALEAAAKKASGHFDPMDQLKMHLCMGSTCTYASGQHEPMHRVNVTRPIPETTREKEKEKQQRSPPTPAETWSQLCLPELELSMTRATFDRWIRPTHLIALTRDDRHTQATILAGDGYAREWLETRLHPIILRTLAGVLSIETQNLTITYEGAEN